MYTMKAPLGVVLFLPLVSVATACVTVEARVGQYGYTDSDYAPAGSACVFPFTYEGISYSTCTNIDNDAMWCYTDSAGSNWGNCDASCPSAQYAPHPDGSQCGCWANEEVDIPYCEGPGGTVPAAMLDADRCAADPRCHWGPAEDPVCTAMLSNPSTVAKASKSARVLMPLK